MNFADRPFPSRRGLDVPALSRLFDDVTTSYKHLFFQALVEAVAASTANDGRFALVDLAAGMLDGAWHPVQVFRLSLGSQDQTAGILRRFAEEGRRPSPLAFREWLADRARDRRALLRHVPYRLLAPFLREHLEAVPDPRRNSRVRVLSNDLFESEAPLYRLVGSDALQVHPDWSRYVVDNLPIVRAWAERRWIAYLQARNPTAPAISEKIRRPLARGSLELQRLYWGAVVGAGAVGCIYTGATLGADEFALDHFVPWSFAGHDALWNLVPTSRSVNSSKGDSLPHPSYVRRFSASHATGLMVSNRTLSPKVWEAATDAYVNDLRLARGELLDPSKVEPALDGVVGAQIELASRMGFEPGWRHKG